MNNSGNVSLYAFEKFGDTVLRAAYSYVHNMSEAEDITQDIFLKLHSNPQEFQSDEHLKAWLIRSAINACKNYFKSARRTRNQAVDDTDESQMSCEFTTTDNEVLDAVRSLPEKYSTALYLFYFEGYSIKDIAQMTGKKENTVSSLLSRGRSKLKMKLEANEYDRARV
ncbi:MAG: sigma-70 family RNA polymerase sigma factor [Lachnospiraceae bacterium]|nr:sigma-70 family RNA polymerase sigma factor [Lachnospiraceae bacterium]